MMPMLMWRSAVMPVMEVVALAIRPVVEEEDLAMMLCRGGGLGRLLHGADNEAPHRFHCGYIDVVKPHGEEALMYLRGTS